MSQGYETHSVGNMANNDVVPVYGKLGNQPWIFIGRTEAEAPILWPPDVKSWITGKDPNAVQDWGQGEKGATEDEMVRWHHWLNGHEFEQTQGESEGQGSLGWCSSWGFKESDKTERLSNNATKQAATLGFDSRASSSMALCLCNTGLNIPNPTSHTVFFLGSVSLCPALLCSPRPDLPVTPDVLTSYFHIPDRKSVV